jgi:hypothetical protein
MARLRLVKFRRPSAPVSLPAAATVVEQQYRSWPRYRRCSAPTSDGLSEAGSELEGRVLEKLVRAFDVRAPDGKVYRAGEYQMPKRGTRCTIIGRDLELYRDGPGRYRLRDGTEMVELPSDP